MHNYLVEIHIQDQIEFYTLCANDLGDAMLLGEALARTIYIRLGDDYGVEYIGCEVVT